jgi:hypothetical protein
MKYVLNHEELFTHPKFSFMFLLWGLIILILIECLNIFQLLFWSTVEFTVIYLMAFKIITWVPKLYYESLLDDQLKDKLFESFNTLHILHLGKNVQWNSRSSGNKLGRFVYKLLRAVYVSVIFYFQPFILIFLYFIFIKQGDLDPTPIDT